MSNPDSSYFIFDTHVAAEDAIRKLGQSGFDMKKLSLVGKGYQYLLLVHGSRQE